MFRLIKKTILGNKQNQIARKYSNVNIVLHPDMPTPSMNKIAQVSGIVSTVNSFEQKVIGLSDEELRNKTQEFKARLLRKQEEYEQQLQVLYEALAQVAIPEEK